VRCKRVWLCHKGGAILVIFAHVLAVLLVKSVIHGHAQRAIGVQPYGAYIIWARTPVVAQFYVLTCACGIAGAACPPWPCAEGRTGTWRSS
jgi:hypothetical protein